MDTEEIVVVEQPADLVVVVDHPWAISSVVVDREVVVAEDQFSIVAEQERGNVVVADGGSGPKGEKGDTGDPGPDVATKTYTASHAVGGHRIVRVTAADQVEYADCTELSHAYNTYGMTLGAAAEGDTVQVRSFGEVVEPTWGWTPGLPIYLSTEGVVSQSLPPGAVFVQIVGFALTATKVQIRFREPIVLA